MEKEIKKGQIWKSKMGGFKIEITHKLTGNGHWMTKKLNKSQKTHKVHEGTLRKFYEFQKTPV